MGVDAESSDLEAAFAAVWQSCAGVDPASLLIPGSNPFSVRREPDGLYLTSHVTGSTYELPPAADVRQQWIEEWAPLDANLFENEPS